MSKVFIVTDDFINLIFKTKKLFENKNITYWVDEGTLLGLVREGNIIDGDHDFDFSLKHNNLKSIIEVCQILESQGYKVKYQKGLPYVEDMIQVYLKNDNDMSNIHIDINIYYIDNGKALRRDLHYPQSFIGKFLVTMAKVLYRKEVDYLKSKNKIKAFIISLIPSNIRKVLSYILMDIYIKFCTTVWHVVPEEFFKNFKEIEFHGHMFPIPQDYEKYLCFRYGVNWRIPDNNWVWKDSPDQAIKYSKLNLINISHE